MSKSGLLFKSVTREKLRKNPDVQAVADELGVHYSTVYRHSAGMDLKLLRSLRKSDWDLKRIIRFMSNDLYFTNKEVAKKLGLTEPYVSQVLSEIKTEAA